MINLFNIPTHKIDTSKFNNLLHGYIVTDFEQQFAEYVGAKYAVGLNSATSAIFLLFLGKKINVEIPSMIPPVVANALITGGNTISFRDDVDWVGGSYVLHDFGDYRVIDSAQKIERDQYKTEAKNESDIIIYSFYPTKPVGSCDGGMIVSNDKAIIDHIRMLSMNGMSCEPNNWERKIVTTGYKMYMNSIQAEIAMNNLNDYIIPNTGKHDQMNTLRNIYNREFKLNNKSLHLYRILVSDNKSYIEKAKQAGITCGIHYAPLHLNPVYCKKPKLLYDTERVAAQTVSIPFHEKLTIAEMEKVITFVKQHKND